jgi:hypothetical protein
VRSDREKNKILLPLSPPYAHFTGLSLSIEAGGSLDQYNLICYLDRLDYRFPNYQESSCFWSPSEPFRKSPEQLFKDGCLLSELFSINITPYFKGDLVTAENYDKL